MSYINDYSNRWLAIFGTSKIQIEEHNMTEDIKSGPGGLSYDVSQAYSATSSYRNSIRNATKHHATASGLNLLRTGGYLSNYLPIIKLVSKTGSDDLYVRPWAKMHGHDPNASISSSSDTAYYGESYYAQNIPSFCAPSPAQAEMITPPATMNPICYYNGFTVDDTVMLNDYWYQAYYDGNNETLGIRFGANVTITNPDPDIPVDTGDITTTIGGAWCIPGIYLGSMANAYGIEVLNEGGGYPMPTSDIPLKDLLNRYGTDFRHNIDIYDETMELNDNMFLNNYVGTIAYTFVNFNEPNGTIRCSTALQFTHFITRSFTNSSIPRVYRVTHRRVINTRVIEYDFTIDYLKDYFQHFGIVTGRYPLLNRSTDPLDYNKMIDDPSLPLSGTFSQEIYRTSDVSARVVIVMSEGDPTVGRESEVTGYSISFGEFYRFTTWWDSNASVQQYQAAFAKQIVAIYAVPYTNMGDNVIVGTANGITFTAGSNTTVYTFTDTAYMINTGNRLTYDISNYVNATLVPVNSGLDMADCRYFISPPTAHIPFYGDIELPGKTLRYMGSLVDPGLSYKYILDINEGTVAISFSPFLDIMPAVKLPQLSLPMDPSVQMMKNADRSLAVQTTGAAMGGVTGVLGAMTTGNIVGGVLAGANTAAGMSSAYMSAQANKQNIIETQGRTLHSSTGLISLSQEPALKFNIPDLAVTSLTDYYDINGYPCLKLWTAATPGCRYWITLPKSALYGTDEYVRGVENAINGRGIVYNY